MNTIFDLKRFAHYVRHHYMENSSFYLLLLILLLFASVASSTPQMLGNYTLYSSSESVVEQLKNSRLTNFVCYLLIVGCVVTKRSVTGRSGKVQSLASLLLPVSKTERYLFVLFNTLIVVPLVTLLVYGAACAWTDCCYLFGSDVCYVRGLFCFSPLPAELEGFHLQHKTLFDLGYWVSSIHASSTGVLLFAINTLIYPFLVAVVWWQTISFRRRQWLGVLLHGVALVLFFASIVGYFTKYIMLPNEVEVFHFNFNYALYETSTIANFFILMATLAIATYLRVVWIKSRNMQESSSYQFFPDLRLVALYVVCFVSALAILHTHVSTTMQKPYQHYQQIAAANDSIHRIVIVGVETPIEVVYTPSSEAVLAGENYQLEGSLNTADLPLDAFRVTKDTLFVSQIGRYTLGEHERSTITLFVDEAEVRVDVIKSPLTRVLSWQAYLEEKRVTRKEGE